MTRRAWPVLCATGLGLACSPPGGGIGSTSAKSSSSPDAGSSGSTGSTARTGTSSSGSGGSSATSTALGSSSSTSGQGSTSGSSSGGGSTSSGSGSTSSGTIGGTVPTLVQHDSSSNTRNNSLSASPYCYYFLLPGPTTAGNAVVVGFTFENNPTPTVSDDQADPYALVASGYDSAQTQSIAIAAATNVKRGARVLSLCFNADPGGNVQPMASEFANVVAVDGQGTTNSGSGTTATSGSLTPTASGDLIYQVVTSLSFAQTSFTASNQAGASWNLLSADLMDGWAAQYGVYASTSALDPALTLGKSDHWLSAAILLKAGQAGGAPSGLHIVRLVHENLPETVPAGGTGAEWPNPTLLQLPCSGNLQIAMVGGGTPVYSTGIADPVSGAWAQAGQSQAGTQAFYVPNAACPNDLDLTVGWTGSLGPYNDYTILFYDVASAAQAPYDTVVFATGSQNATEPSGDTLTMSYTLSPATQNELVLSENMWAYNTGSGLENALFDANTFSGESVSGPEPVDENNGWGHVITSSAAPVSVVWDLLFPNLPVGAFAGMSVAFEAAGAQPAPPQPRFEQVASATPQQPEQSVSATFGAQKAGDANIVVVGWMDATTTPAGNAVTDSSGNSYQLVAGPTRSANYTQIVYFASSIAAAASSNTVTIAFPNAVPFANLRILEYSDIHAVDQVAGASGATQTASTASLTTTAGPEVIVAAATTAGTFTGPGAGYTQRILTTPDGDIVEDMAAATAGTYAVSAQQGSAAEWVMQAVSFK